MRVDQFFRAISRDVVVVNRALAARKRGRPDETRRIIAPGAPALAVPSLSIKTWWCLPETSVTPSAAGQGVGHVLAELGRLQDLAEVRTRSLSEDGGGAENAGRRKATQADRIKIKQYGLFLEGGP